MNILIYGSGGIGGFLGAFLLKSNFQIFFLARGNTYKKFSQNGLILNSEIENIKCKEINLLNNIKKCPELDIVILAVKLYDLEYSLNELSKYAKGDFTILPFQNGVIAESMIKKKFGKEKVFGAVAQISSFLDDNKRIIHNGRLASFFVGKIIAKNNYENKIFRFSEKVNSLGIDFRYSNKITQKIWDKFIFLSAYSGITTLTEMTIGEIFDNKNYRDLFIKAMEETFLLSKKKNIKFDYNPVAIWIERISKMPRNLTSSMFIDFKKKKKLELDWLSGNVISMGKEVSISCDAHNTIVEGIKSK